MPPMANNGNTSKRHHYVPQGYLRGFATDKERIHVIPLDASRKTYTSSVKNVATENHFHTIEGLKEPDYVEKALSVVEGEAISILRKFEKGEFPPSESDRQTLAAYMALQNVRGPDTRRTREHLFSMVARLKIGAGGRKKVSGHFEKAHGIAPTPEEIDQIWKEATQIGGPRIVLPNEDHIQHMVDLAEKLTPYIANRPWSLVQFVRRSLITSDAPVGLVPDPDDEPWDGVGFATATGITFPISRKLGLLMHNPMDLFDGATPDGRQIDEIRTSVLRGNHDRTIQGSTALENLFNAVTVNSASEYVYHHPEDTRFIPSALPEANLIRVKGTGILDAEFDGEPWFERP